MSKVIALHEAQERLMRDRRKDAAQNPGYERIGDGLTKSALEQIAQRAIEAAGSEEGRREFEKRQREERERWRASIASDRREWARFKSGIPAKHLKLLERVELDTNAGPCEAVIGSISAGAKMIGLMGPTGTGKTLAAAWGLWTRRLEVDRDRLEADPAREGPSPGMFITAFRYSRIPPWDQAEHVANVTPLLVLDDLGRESADKRVDTEELLMQRYDNDLLTIFTTNLDGEGFADAYDNRIVSRILEVGAIHEVSDVLRPGQGG